jgi:RNA polymerase sigma-70 factor (family 1)
LTKEEFKSLYDRHFDAIRNYLYYRSGDPELATDLAQEAFLRVWEKQLDQEENKMKGLLYKIAGDLFIDQLRKNKVQTEYARKVEFNFKSQQPDASLEFLELKAIYERALGEMPENQRITFLMSRMEEMTYKEIADRLGLSLKAVEKRMSQAISSLKLKLGHHG